MLLSTANLAQADRGKVEETLLGVVNCKGKSDLSGKDVLLDIFTPMAYLTGSEKFTGSLVLTSGEKPVLFNYVEMSVAKVNREHKKIVGRFESTVRELDGVWYALEVDLNANTGTLKAGKKEKTEETMSLTCKNLFR